MTRRLVILATCLVALAHCSRGDTSIVRIGTNRAEIAAYASYLNAHQAAVRIELEYLEDPGSAVAPRAPLRAPPDVIIATGLCCPSLLSQFDVLDDLFADERVDARDFYPGLLEVGRHEEGQYLLPLSFNIPAAVFRHEGEGGGPGLILTIEEMKRRSVAYNREREGSYSRLGYSPLWSESFVLLAARLHGTAFRANPDGDLLWDEQALAASVALLRDWVIVGNGGIDAQTAFESKYMYDPPLNLVRDGRILYAQLSSEEIFGLPKTRIEGLDFRWLALGESIPVSEDVVFAGVPDTAANKAGARRVLAELFTPEVQERLIERSFTTQMSAGVFGVGDGFSALREVTEKVYPNHYPLLIGHIPPAGFLRFPDLLPRQWPEMRASLIGPWLMEQLSAEGATGSELSEQLGANLREGLDEMAREKQ